MNNGDRLHALDAVRAFALLLGVVYHATLSFIPADELADSVVPRLDVYPSIFLSLVAFTGHMFRMPLFFMMAGFFARLMIARKGPWGFWSDRLQRILIPLVVGWMVFYPMVSAAWSWGRTGTIDPGRLIPWPLSVGHFPVSYLWFLWYLLLLYVLMSVVGAVVLAVDRKERLRQIADELFRRVFGSRWAAPVLLAGVLAPVLLRQGIYILMGLPPPNDSLIPKLVPLAAFSIPFAVGWMFHRNVDLLHLLPARWRGHLIAAVCATIVCIVCAGPLMEQRSVESARLAYTGFGVFYALGWWCWILGVTGVALRFLSNPSPARRYVADASYWIYLVHYPIVLAMQDLLGDVPLHWVIKFPVIVGVTVAISLVTYHYLVRFTIIGRVLNGRRSSRAGEGPGAGGTVDTSIPPAILK